MSVTATIELFRPGFYDDVDWTPDMVAAMARNYDPTWQKSPLVVGHAADDSKDAVGWIVGLAFDGQSLKAEVEVEDDDTIERVRSKGLQYVSAELVPNFHGVGPYVYRAALLGAVPPRVKGMQPIEFSDKAFCATPAIPPDNQTEKPPMDEKQIEKVAEGVFSRLMGRLMKPIVFSDTTEPGDGVKPDAALAELSAKIAALEAENADLKGKFADGEKAKVDAEVASREAEATKFADDAVKSLGIAPAHRDAVKSYWLATDAVKATEFADSMPKVNPNLTATKTGGAAGVGDDPRFQKFMDRGYAKEKLQALTVKFKDAGMARTALLAEWTAARQDD